MRINIYTTDIDEFPRAAADTVFGWFGGRQPASTLVEVTRLAHPAHRLEVDATAVSYD